MDFLLLKTCEHLKKNQTYKVWQNSYQAEHIYSNSFKLPLQSKAY